MISICNNEQYGTSQSNNCLPQYKWERHRRNVNEKHRTPRTGDETLFCARSDAAGDSAFCRHWPTRSLPTAKPRYKLGDEVIPELQVVSLCSAAGLMSFVVVAFKDIGIVYRSLEDVCKHSTPPFTRTAAGIVKTDHLIRPVHTYKVT